MEILVKILQLILSLSLLVFVHELGHFLAARMFGIRVDKFYIFFDAGGFSIFRFKIGDTTFGLGWVPFGGYCKIAGMIDESMDTEAMKQPPQPWEFRSKPAWQRLVVMVAGVVMNLVTACLVYIGMSWHWGDNYIDNADVRWGYSFGELAREIGFEDGDRVVSVDGALPEGDFFDIPRTILLNDRTTVRVERGGVERDIEITENYKAALLKSGSFMEPRYPFVVAGTEEGSPAALAGIMPGDSLVAFGGVPVSFTSDVRRALADAAGGVARVTMARDSSGVRVLRTLEVPVSDEGQLGVMIKAGFVQSRGGRLSSDFFPIRTRSYSLAESIPTGLRKAGKMVSDYWKQLKMMVQPKTEAYKQVGSFITIGSIFPGVWDWFEFWRVTAFISIALALLNILPIPALDGGHVLFLLWEVVTRRRPSDKFLEWMQVLGLVILGALIILTFGNDIYRFFIR